MCLVTDFTLHFWVIQVNWRPIWVTTNVHLSTIILFIYLSYRHMRAVERVINTTLTYFHIGLYSSNLVCISNKKIFYWSTWGNIVHHPLSLCHSHYTQLLLLLTFSHHFLLSICLFVALLLIGPLMCLANQTTTPMQLKPDYSSSLWSVTEGAVRGWWEAQLYHITHIHTHLHTHRVSKWRILCLRQKVSPEFESLSLFHCKTESLAVWQNVLYLLIAAV